LRHIDFEYFIITTPNADFNQFYELDGFRHDDHKWEMGKDAFQQWFSNVIKGVGVNTEFVDIGDAVNGIHTTQGVIVRRKEA
jgi:hypothetical protein